MRNILNWQYSVNLLNQQKGFYDYKADIAIIEDALGPADQDNGLEPFDVVRFHDAVGRVVADYKKAMLERKLLLAIGELCEAHEELRSGHAPDEVYYKPDNPQKPEGFPIEVADAHIRLWDLEHESHIDSEQMIVQKHEYNETRPHKHGRQF